MREEREQALFFLVSWKLFDESLMIMRCHLHFPNEVEIDVICNRKTSVLPTFCKISWNLISIDSLNSSQQRIVKSLWTSIAIFTKPFQGLLNPKYDPLNFLICTPSGLSYGTFEGSLATLCMCISALCKDSRRPPQSSFASSLLLAQLQQSLGARLLSHFFRGSSVLSQ